MEIKRQELGDQVTLAVKGEIEVYSLTEFSRIAESYLAVPRSWSWTSRSWSTSTARASASW